jgi:PhnB protein
MMQTRLNPYLEFKGNARAAMEFYKSVFGGKLDMSTYKEYHASQNPSDDNKIMHAQLENEDGLTFMGADAMDEAEYREGNNYAMSLSGYDPDLLRDYFEKLSAGGTVIVPLAQAPWGDTFGMFVDKFGVKWMVNIAGQQPTP